MSDYEFGYWVWRGHKEDIEKLKEQTKELSKKSGCYRSETKLVSGDIYEVTIYCKKMLTLVKMFPQLKAIGFVEDWSDKSGYLFFSDVGQKKCDKDFIDYFDGHEEDRWTMNAPTEDFNYEGIYIQTGDEYYVDYEFELKDEWEKDNY